MTRLELPASVRALNPGLLDEVHHRRSQSSRRADAVGRRWEAVVAHALDVLKASGDVALYLHPHPRRSAKGKPIEASGVDFVGVLCAEARGFAVECKTTTADVWLTPAAKRTRSARCVLSTLQRSQLDAMHDAGGVALIVVQMRDLRAVIPWSEVQGEERIVRTVAQRWECRAVADGLRREMER